MSGCVVSLSGHRRRHPEANRHKFANLRNERAKNETIRNKANESNEGSKKIKGAEDKMKINERKKEKRKEY